MTLTYWGYDKKSISKRKNDKVTEESKINDLN
jgi:hypothetical protein